MDSFYTVLQENTEDAVDQMMRERKKLKILIDRENYRKQMLAEISAEVKKQRKVVDSMNQIIKQYDKSLFDHVKSELSNSTNEGETNESEIEQVIGSGEIENKRPMLYADPDSDDEEALAFISDDEDNEFYQYGFYKK